MITSWELKYKNATRKRIECSLTLREKCKSSNFMNVLVHRKQSKCALGIFTIKG